jgi:GT2 family glycosyltransferase
VPAISVIILNHDGRRWLHGCIDAIAAQAGAPEFETLVVDNASRDGSVEAVGSEFPWVRTIRLGSNVGFAAGNNAGARDARGEWLAFLNNDTVADPHWLANLWRAAAAHPEYALFTSRIVFLHDPARIDSAGDGYLRAGGAYKHGHGAPAARFAESREVFGACGAAFLIRRDAFDALGGFDERFFMVYEDVDLSYRARLRGFRVWYVADAVVHHAGSGSIGVLSERTVFYGQRNLEWTWLKNTPARLLVTTALPHIVYSLAGLAHYVGSGRGWAALRGKAAALAGVVAVLADRRRVQADAARPLPPVEHLMERQWLAAKQREKQFDAGRVTDSA